MVRTVCLDEDEHAVNMLRNLKQMKHEEDLCDFTVTVQGQEYRTHKTILSAGSPYFKAMLKHDTKESREGKVEMKDVDAECVKSCIDFIYTGKFDIPDGKIGKLLHVAVIVQLDNVKKSVCDILVEELNAENFYETKSIAEMYDLINVSSRCKVYFEGNFLAVSAQPGFTYEIKHHIVSILKSKILRLSEEDRLTALVRWVGEDPEKKVDLPDLFKMIDMKKVSSKYLNGVLQNCPVISNDFHLYKLISSALIESMMTASSGNDVDPASSELIILFDDTSKWTFSCDPAKNEITKFHNADIEDLGFFTAVTMDPYVYVFCQDQSVHRLIFRDKNSKWQKMTNMLADHGQFPPSVSLSGSLFLIGSSGSYANSSAAVETFNPVANSWQRLKDKPEAIAEVTLVCLDASIYCIGGCDGYMALDIFCKFTPSSSDWVDLEPMINARRYCGAVAVGQKIFVVGGSGDSKEMSDVECYNVTSGQWTPLSPMTEAHSLSFAHHINGWIYPFDYWKPLNQVEIYDIANDRWCKFKFKETEENQACWPHASTSVHT